MAMSDRAYALSDFPAEFQERVFINTLTGCWHWTGRANKSGYGYYRGKGAHVFACEFAHGIMENGLFACHKCDMPRCVNPAHLYPGTNFQNIQDMQKTGRKAHGERASKLTHEQVTEMLADDKRLPWELAKDFGISESTVLAMFAGNSWKHMPRQRSFEEVRATWTKLQGSKGKEYKRPRRQKKYWETITFEPLIDADLWLIRVLFEHAELSGKICTAHAEWNLPLAGLCRSGESEAKAFNTQLDRIFSFRIDYSQLKRNKRQYFSILYPRTNLFSHFDTGIFTTEKDALRYGISWDLIHVIEDNGVSALMDLITLLHGAHSHVEQAELLEAQRKLKEQAA